MIKPWLCIPSSISHKIAPKALNLITPLLKSEGKPTHKNPLRWRDLTFPNRLGTAAGLDKEGTQVSSWWKWGIGFQEVGTITPLPQKPNPGTIIKRYNNEQIVWNKMGFPSSGFEVAKTQLLKLPQKKPTPLFINIGKNRDTTNKEAFEDYKKGLLAFSNIADVFVLNLSSPNTKGLRDLLLPEALHDFLVVKLRSFLNENNLKQPILLKVSPDMDLNQIKSILKISHEANIDGWVLTNTTAQRDTFKQAPKEGGLSGKALTKLSRDFLTTWMEELKHLKFEKKPLVISVGGVSDSQEFQTRLSIGADLVQIYSSLIFKGPGLIHKIL